MAERGELMFGATSIEYSVIRSRRRRKTIEITLDPSQGVLVAVPAAVSTRDAKSIVRKHARWIVRRSNEAILRPRRKELVTGAAASYLGRRARLVVQEGPVEEVTVTFDHWRLRVTVPWGLDGDQRHEEIGQGLARWYERRAQARLEDRVRYWSRKLRLRPSRILTRSQRQRWGSCSADGTIRFNWRIVMAEPAVMDYLVVHELLHLTIRNHSAKYWATVKQAMPDYKQRQARLRECGPFLSF
ncbi:MAG: SprT family zinc-dependent metalloprotease [Dehalococcoidia bacterium]